MSISPTEDPLELFETWFQEARESEINDPNAIALATVDANGMPNVRIVLLKEYDERGFVFYTSLESAKGLEILATGKIAACIHWKSQHRQIRLRGTTELVADQQADEYFISRPRKSRIGAWASQQSRPLKSRRYFLQQVAKFGLKFAIGPIPRPTYWSGVRLKPVLIEFWEEGGSRLHDRIEYRRGADGSSWACNLLYP